ncbi:MAG: hydrogenase maturation protein [Rhodospirillales bacterium]|nr:hydrogenase maturation protein [Rhodospirillales bacterium]
MRILLLAHSFNSLTQRVWVELAARGHELALELDIKDSVAEEALDLFRPDLIVAPFLKRAIPASVWQAVRCLVIHPGPPGDRGPSALDWAILDGCREWGVTVLEAVADFDAGPVWAHRNFQMRDASKGSLYRRDVTEAAIEALLEALARIEAGEKPIPAQPGVFRPTLPQARRSIDWRQDTTADVLRKIRSGDGTPGVRDLIEGQDYFLFDAKAADLSGRPGDLLAVTGCGAVARASRDGAVWIGHLRPLGKESLKLPSAHYLKTERLARHPAQDILYEEQGPVGILRFPFYNGAMSKEQCHRLCSAFLDAAQRPTRVILLAGGEDSWSNGIHLGAIEAADSVSDESWANINAIDDLAAAIITCRSHLTVSAMAGNAGAGGVFLALAADRVLMRDGIVLNPHYKSMGNLYGSEYWTYLLPRRASHEQARHIQEARLPMGAGQALSLGLADEVLPGTAPGFQQAALKKAQELAADDAFAARLQEKNDRRDADEAIKPLAAYRALELEKMRLNFYGFDPSYHVARYHFIFKSAKSRTPLYLAPHRRAKLPA